MPFIFGKNPERKCEPSEPKTLLKEELRSLQAVLSGLSGWLKLSGHGSSARIAKCLESKISLVVKYVKSALELLGQRFCRLQRVRKKHRFRCEHVPHFKIREMNKSTTARRMIKKKKKENLKFEGIPTIALLRRTHNV